MSKTLGNIYCNDCGLDCTKIAQKQDDDTYLCMFCMYKLLNWKDLGPISTPTKLKSTDFVLVKREDAVCRKLKVYEIGSIFPKEGCIWVKVKSSKIEHLGYIKNEIQILVEELHQTIGSKLSFIVTNEDVSFEDITEKLKEAEIEF